MKKQIAVICTNMIVGGVEKALLCLLDTIDKDRYDVTLFTQNKEGAFIDQIPSHVDIWTTDKEFRDSKQLLADDMKHLRVLSVSRGVVLRILLHFSKHPYRQLLLTQGIQRKIPKRFDCAIAYKLNYDDTAFLMARISATKKCAWVHGMVRYSDEVRYFYHSTGPIKKIFCVSKHSKAQLEKEFPHLASKTEVFYNLIDVPGITKAAQIPLPEDLSKTSLVTVGRLAEEKGQDMIPKVTRLLLDAGYDIYWYLIGDGPLREKIEEELAKYDVADHVHLLGVKMDPYPYIKNCDIYVQTSRSEGWCLTVQEAKILQRPIVATGLPVLREQIAHGVNGSLAADVSAEALATEIIRLLKHPEIQQKYITALKNEASHASNEIRKLYDFIEN